MADTILRFPSVKERTGLSRSNIYRKIEADEFPKPISLGARAVGWSEISINKWIDNQIKQSQKGAA